MAVAMAAAMATAMATAMQWENLQKPVKMMVVLLYRVVLLAAVLAVLLLLLLAAVLLAAVLLAAVLLQLLAAVLLLLLLATVLLAQGLYQNWGSSSLQIRGNGNTADNGDDVVVCGDAAGQWRGGGAGYGGWRGGSTDGACQQGHVFFLHYGEYCSDGCKPDEETGSGRRSRLRA
jgi:hypothetical protein